jgi:hypothetical protein
MHLKYNFYTSVVDLDSGYGAFLLPESGMTYLFANETCPQNIRSKKEFYFSSQFLCRIRDPDEMFGSGLKHPGSTTLLLHPS